VEPPPAAPTEAQAEHIAWQQIQHAITFKNNLQQRCMRAVSSQLLMTTLLSQGLHQTRCWFGPQPVLIICKDGAKHGHAAHTHTHTMQIQHCILFGGNTTTRNMLLAF
jgi:hypothetical protein